MNTSQLITRNQKFHTSNLDPNHLQLGSSKIFSWGKIIFISLSLIPLLIVFAVHWCIAMARNLRIILNLQYFFCSVGAWVYLLSYPALLDCAMSGLWSPCQRFVQAPPQGSCIFSSTLWISVLLCCRLIKGHFPNLRALPIISAFSCIILSLQSNFTFL